MAVTVVGKAADVIMGMPDTLEVDISRCPPGTTGVRVHYGADMFTSLICRGDYGVRTFIAGYTGQGLLAPIDKLEQQSKVECDLVTPPESGFVGSRRQRSVDR